MFLKDNHYTQTRRILVLVYAFELLFFQGLCPSLFPSILFVTFSEIDMQH